MTLLVLTTSSPWLPVTRAEETTANIAYSFRTSDSGGVGELAIDGSTGVIVSHKALFHDSNLDAPHKLRRESAGQMIVMTNASESEPLLLIGRAGEPAEPRTVRLPGKPIELEITPGLHPHQVIVTCDNDWIVLIDLESAVIVGQWNTESLLSPPGNAPSDICITEDGQSVVIVCHDDSKKGKKLGCRLLLFKRPEMSLQSDIRFPRDLPTLHVAGNLRLQGPNPATVLLGTKSNSLLTLHEFYGAAEIDAWEAMRDSGKRVPKKVLATAVDNSWGTSFPERAALFEWRDQEYAIICNQGATGGCLIVDLADGSIVWRAPLPGGMERPVCMVEHDAIFLICSGELKSRVPTGIAQSLKPSTSLYRIDLADLKSRADLAVVEIPLEQFGFRIAQVSDSPYLLIATSADGQTGSQLCVYDVRSQKFTGKAKSLGMIGRLEHGTHTARRAVNRNARPSSAGPSAHGSRP